MTAFAPIAIVGRACVLPGALSPAELWDRVVAGDDLITQAPPDRWQIDPDDVMGTPSGRHDDRAVSDRGGYIHGFESVFDPHGFGVSAEEIAALDPVFQWTFHTAREALRDAGRDGDDASRFGAIFGNLSFPSAGMASFVQRTMLGAAESADRNEPAAAESGVGDARNRFMSGLPALLLERALGLGVGAFALDAACASSLYAIKLACDRLHDGDADLMLAGAVNCADDLFIHVGFTALNALSVTGRSRPFHLDADGLVPAEGCGFVALRRLADAVGDGDTIHGIIRGVGLSNDGRGRGMLVPSGVGQTRAMLDAFEVAGLDPTDVSLLECHATGTLVGDATEVTSTAQVYADCVDLPIGSLKSNTGHLITAAGVAGVIKVIEAMRHEVRPPTLHVEQALRELDDSPFRLLTAAEPWRRGETVDGVLRAGISAFGFGGNNAHLIIEEPGSAEALLGGWEPPPQQSRGPIAIVSIGVTAARAVGLDAFTDALLDGTPCLDADGTGPLPDIVLRLEAQKFPPNDLRAALSQQLAMLQVADEAVTRVGSLPKARTGVYVGMGTDPQAARFGVRWRIAALAHEQGEGPEWTAHARDAVSPVLGAAGVLGTMPNLVANRLNSQYDIAGPSFAVSGEEHSGLDALAIAVRGLRRGDIDAALVGAVDLACDLVHQAAARVVLPADDRAPGDAAVMLVLKRLDDAEHDGDMVYAVICGERIDADGNELARHSDASLNVDAADGIGNAARSAPASLSSPDATTNATTNAPTEATTDATSEATAGADDVVQLFGHAHAASGLVQVAAAAVLLHHRARLGGAPLMASNPQSGGGLPEGAGPRSVRVTTTAFDGAVRRSVLLAEASDHLPPSRLRPPRLHMFSGDDASGVLEALDSGRESDGGPARLVIVADSPEQLAMRSQRARAHLDQGNPAGTGVHFRAAPIAGEMAFVFTAGGAAYSGMGAQLLRALPEIVTPLSTNFGLGEVASWIYRPDHVPEPADYLWGSALIGLAHARLTREILGLRPQAAIGYSSGETTMLFAFGVWSDMDAMRREIADSHMLDREIAVEFAAVARAWGVDRADWAVWNVLAPIADVRRVIADEPRLHLMLINTDRDVVIAGDVAAGDRVVQHLGPQRCRPVDYNLACHVPEVRAEFHQPWLDIHTRHVTPVDGVRFYSNGVTAAYDVSTEACAAAITAQAETTVDFPATIRSAYADGVRIFVEHGPSGACTNFIREVLADHDVLAVHLDRRDNNIEQVFEVCAALTAAGVAVDHVALTTHLRGLAPATHAAPAGPTITFRTHPAPIQLPPRTAAADGSAGIQLMARAPQLPVVIDLAAAVRRPVRPQVARIDPPVEQLVAAPVQQRVQPVQLPVAAHRAPHEPTVDGDQGIAAASVLLNQIAGMNELHQAFVSQQTAMHERFLATRTATLGLLARGDAAVTPAPHTPRLEVIAAAPPVTAQAPPVSHPTPPPVSHPAPPPVDDLGERRPIAPQRGPRWGRAELMVHSSGRISDLFGPMFTPQDDYLVQCRMPEPPLLLADRVTGIDAEVGRLGVGTIWTATDIEPDSWYLNGGHMPAGFMIESGQADLMLISYMGIDLLNKGERSYRLLGCTLVYHGDLPTGGDTLEYEIRITGHAKHGDIRLFFFEYDCVVAGQRRLTVRDAQAGFFTSDELRDAQGALWTPESTRAELRADARVDPAVIECVKHAFSADDVRAFSEGRTLDCFGPGFEWAETHTRTPKIQAGDQLFIDEVTHFDPSGGPWGRGYMRCKSSIRGDEWFFDGHFKNDPCMPGNFMVEACIEAMSFYLAALGHTTRADGWRFQPLPEQPFELKCRGEINPHTECVAYELHVEEIWSGPHPTIICDVLGFVDGKPAFHAHRIGVELVPGWPLTTMPEIYEQHVLPAAANVPATDADGFVFDWKAMISCAWGKPSDAFGSLYAGFDDTRRSPRLPGEPYHFISRIIRIDGPLGQCVPGIEIVCEYDIPHDAWYFDSNGAATMPFAVLLEAALQPCGWLASAVGSVAAVDDDMLFRNLDGTGTLLGELTRTAGILTTRVTLTSVSQAGGMIIEAFGVECSLGDRPVFTMDTVFGFFPPEAFHNQVGLAISASDRSLAALAREPASELIDLTVRPERFCSGTARLADDMLLMLDRARHVRGAGVAGLGVVVAEKDVDVSEWFFTAHFFQDPVQPGSLGIEALLQLLQFFMLDTDMHAGLDRDVGEVRFEPMLQHAPMVWKYRGQVTPNNSLITTVMEITEVGTDANGPYVIGAGSLWCDGLRIYEVSNMGMRLVSVLPAAAPIAAPSTPESTRESTATSVSTLEVTVNLANHRQLLDHAVNGTPVVPVALVLEWFARLAQAHCPRMHLDQLSDLRVLSGLVADQFHRGGDLPLAVTVVRSETSVNGCSIGMEVTESSTGRTHYRCSATLRVEPSPPGPRRSEPAQRSDDPGSGGGEPWTGEVYFGETLFHGPAFRVIDDVPFVTEHGMDAVLWGVLAVNWPNEPWVSDPALIDGALQLALLWTERQLGSPSLPTAIGNVRLCAPPTRGRHTATLVGRRATANMVVCDVSIWSTTGALVAQIDGIETHRLPSTA